MYVDITFRAQSAFWPLQEDGPYQSLYFQQYCDGGKELNDKLRLNHSTGSSHGKKKM